MSLTACWLLSLSQIKSLFLSIRLESTQRSHNKEHNFLRKFYILHILQQKHTDGLGAQSCLFRVWGRFSPTLRQKPKQEIRRLQPQQKLQLCKLQMSPCTDLEKELSKVLEDPRPKLGPRGVREHMWGAGAQVTGTLLPGDFFAPA